MSLPLPALITQLRTAYPAASLTSELLAIESNTFVVRALIQMGSVTLATGLAAAAEVETAEDRAKSRAIETLMPAAIPGTIVPETIEPEATSPGQAANPAGKTGSPTLTPLPPIVPPAAEPIPPKPELVRSATLPIAEPQPKTASSNSPANSPANSSASPEALTDWDNPLSPARSSSNLDFDFDLDNLLQNTPVASPPNPPVEDDPQPVAADLFTAVTSDPTMSIDPPVNLADLNLKKLTLPDAPEAGATAKPARRRGTTASLPAPESDSEPIPPFPEGVIAPPFPEEAPPVEIDRSGEIARIGVEMKRLGWDTKKGRDHLQKTYGKRSRQELNDDELMDFLRYLEAQPSSASMPF